MHSIISSITFITLWRYKDVFSWSINWITQHQRKWRRSYAEVGKNKSYSTACGLKLNTLYTFVMLHLLTRNQSKEWMIVICKNHLAHHASISPSKLSFARNNITSSSSGLPKKLQFTSGDQLLMATPYSMVKSSISVGASTLSLRRSSKLPDLISSFDDLGRVFSFPTKCCCLRRWAPVFTCATPSLSGTLPPSKVGLCIDKTAKHRKLIEWSGQQQIELLSDWLGPGDGPLIWPQATIIIIYWSPPQSSFHSLVRGSG